MKNKINLLVAMLLVAMPAAARIQNAAQQPVQELMQKAQFNNLQLSVKQLKEKVQNAMPEAKELTASGKQIHKAHAVEGTAEGDSILTYWGEMLTNVELFFSEGDWNVYTSYDVALDGSRIKVERIEEMGNDDKYEMIQYLGNGDEWYPVRREVTDYDPLEETDYYNYYNGMWQNTGHYSWTQEISENGRKVVSTQVTTSFDEEGNTIDTDIIERTFVDSLLVKEVYIDSDDNLTIDYVLDEEGDPVLISYAQDGVVYYTEEYTYDDEGKTIEFKDATGFVFMRVIDKYSEDGEIATLEELDEYGELFLSEKMIVTYTDEAEITIEQAYSEDYGDLINVSMEISHYGETGIDYEESYYVGEDGEWERSERTEYYQENGVLTELRRYFGDDETPLIIRFFWGNEETNGIETMALVAPQQCFDLQGRTIEAPANGLFIRGGKICIQK